MYECRWSFYINIGTVSTKLNLPVFKFIFVKANFLFSIDLTFSFYSTIDTCTEVVTNLNVLFWFCSCFAVTYSYRYRPIACR